jgi:hypothetical protein
VDELKAEIGTKKPQKEKEYDLEAEMLGTGNSSARQRTAIEKHREQLRKIEKERKESQEVCAPKIDCFPAGPKKHRKGVTNRYIIIL